MISGIISISVNVYKQENSNIMKKKFIIVIKTEIPNLKSDFFLFTIYINWQGYQNALVSSSMTGYFQILASYNSLV